MYQFSSVQLLNHVWYFVIPWTAALQASLSINNSGARPPCPSPTPGLTQTHVNWVSDASQPSHPLLSPSPPASNLSQHGVFSSESALGIRGPKYWSLSFSIVLPMSTQDWSPLRWTGWISLQSKGLSRVFSSTTVQKHQFFSAQLSL